MGAGVALDIEADRYRAGKRLWSAADDAELRRIYPDASTAQVARQLRRTKESVYGRAGLLGLHKSDAYLASPAACRLRRGDQVGKAFRFPKGHAPANKGLRRPGFAPGRMRETQFKKGCATNWMPVGSTRLVDGYRYRKTSDVRHVPWTRNWRPEHVVIWEEVNGPLPRGHALAFRNRDRTDVRLDNLELITRRELMARNTVHNLPKPLKQTVQLLGALNRQIRRRTRDAEHDRGPADTPLRHPQVAEGQGPPDGPGARADRRGSLEGDRRLGEGRSRLPEGDRRDQEHRIPAGRGRAAGTEAAGRPGAEDRVSAIDPADVLAILEERPYSCEDLAEVFDASPGDMKATLRAMKRDGLLKQVGTAQQWALVSFVAETGRRPTLDREAVRTAILAAVAAGPTPTHAIVDASGFSRTTVKGELEALMAGGQLQHLGAGRGAMWALASWVVPVPDDVDEAIASDAEELEDLDAAADDDVEQEDLPPVPQRERGQRRLYPAGTRQTAKAKTSKPVDEPAWWVGLDRAAFSVAAGKRAEVMREAKENRLVPVRILQ